MRETTNTLSECAPPPATTKTTILLFIFTLSAIVALALFGGERRERKQGLPSTAAHALVILPVQQSGLPAEEGWLKSGGVLLLRQSLQELQEIRLLELGDVTRALQLFQQQHPSAEDRQTQLIGRMLGADYLLSARVSPVAVSENVVPRPGAGLPLRGDKANQLTYRVVLKLLSLHAGGRGAEILADERLAPEALPGFFQGAGSLVREALRIEGEDRREVPLLSLDAERYTLAENAYARGRFPEAAGQLAKLLRSQPGYAPGWLLLARVQQAGAQKDNDLAEQAQDSLRRVMAASHPGSLLSFQAQALSAQWSGDRAAAETYLRRLIAAFPNHISARTDLAALLMEQGLFEPALRELRAVVELDPQHPRAWLELAKAAIVSGDAQRAVDEYLVEALAAYSHLQDLSGRGDVLNAFGVAHQRLGHWQQARDYYKQGLEVRRGEGDRRGQVISLSNLAALHSMRGEVVVAEKKLREALAVAEGLGDPKAEGEIHNQMGLLEEERGRYRDALAHYREALAIHMRLDDVWLRAESQNNVGFIYFLMSDYDHAMVYWNSARENFALARDALGEIQVQQNIAQLEIQRGNWPEALQVLQAGEKLAWKEELSSEAMVIRAYLGRLAFLQGRFQSAAESWDDAFAFMRERGDMRGAIEFGLWRAELSLALGRLKRAARQLEELDETLSEHGSPEQRVAEKLLQLQLALHNRERQRAEEVFAQLKPLLSEDVPRSLHLRAGIAAVQLGREDRENLREMRWVDHPLEQLQWLEVQAAKLHARSDWAGLELSLAEARPLLEKLDGYWRGYIFDHLSFQLSQHLGRADTDAGAAARRTYSDLLEQIADEDRAAFRTRNPGPGEVALNTR